jgi:hypothetical protein
MFIQISTNFRTLYEFLDLIKQKRKLENDLPATGLNLAHERGPQGAMTRSTRHATRPRWAALAGPAQGCHRLSRPTLPARLGRAPETVAARGAPTTAHTPVVDWGPRCGGDSGSSTRSPRGGHRARKEGVGAHCGTLRRWGDDGRQHGGICLRQVVRGGQRGSRDAPAA